MRIRVRALIVLAVLMCALQAAAQRHSVPEGPEFAGVGTASFAGEVADIITGGWTFQYGEADGRWRAAAFRGPDPDDPVDAIAIEFDADERAPTDQAGSWDWYFTTQERELTAGPELIPGNYEVNLTPEDGPLFYVLGSVNSGCTTFPTGNFTVSAVELGCEVEEGVFIIKSFSVSGEHYCGGVVAERLLDFTVTFSNPEAESCSGSGGPGGPSTPPPPPEPPFRVTFGSINNPGPVSIGNSESASVTFTSVTDADFSSDLFFTVTTDAKEHENFHASITPEMIPAPGIGEGVLTITTGPTTFPRTYQVVVHATDGKEVSSRAYLIDVACTPPTILGINQPVSVSKNVGEQVSFKVTPNGSGPFTYQWYRGMRGMTRNPVAAEHFDTLDFTATQNGHYWVRVSNACGTVDSNSVYLSTNGEGPIRRR